MAGDRRERRHDGAGMALRGKILKKAMGNMETERKPVSKALAAFMRYTEKT